MLNFKSFFVLTYHVKVESNGQLTWFWVFSGIERDSVKNITCCLRVKALTDNNTLEPLIIRHIDKGFIIIFSNLKESMQILGS